MTHPVRACNVPGARDTAMNKAESLFHPEIPRLGHNQNATGKHAKREEFT